MILCDAEVDSWLGINGGGRIVRRFAMAHFASILLASIMHHRANGKENQ